MFSEELAKYDWEETTRQIQHKRPADVETALGKEHLTLDDFMALISPAAAAYLAVSYTHLTLPTTPYV